MSKRFIIKFNYDIYNQSDGLDDYTLNVEAKNEIEARNIGLKHLRGCIDNILEENKDFPFGDIPRMTKIFELTKKREKRICSQCERVWWEITPSAMYEHEYCHTPFCNIDCEHNSQRDDFYAD